MWSPADSVPHIAGGFVEALADVVVKTSNMQFVAYEEPLAWYSLSMMSPTGVPSLLLTVPVVTVLGPVITKVVKSRRIEHISGPEGQTFKSHVDAVVGNVVGVVHAVLFSLVVLPQFLISNVQHTPKPSAHDPALVPFLSEHSCEV
jgi:hypothetical protein